MNPSNLNCKEIGSLKYRKLCQTLSVPITTRKENKAFTGNLYTDLLILKEFTDEELINVCAVNVYVNNLCNKDSFWSARTLDKFRVLGNAEEIKERYIPDGTSWKEYYLWLSGLMEGPVEVATIIAIENDRNDLKLLLGINQEFNQEFNPLGGLGFNTPIFVNENLLSFLREGNFGPSDPNNPYSTPLNNLLLVTHNGITNRNQLTMLFTIYTFINKLQDPFNRGILTADDLMRKYFEIDKFRYAHFQKIASKNTIKTSDLTPEQDEFIQKRDLFQRLIDENKYLKWIMDYYREKFREEKEKR